MGMGRTDIEFCTDESVEALARSYLHVDVCSRACASHAYGMFYSRFDMQNAIVPFAVVAPKVPVLYLFSRDRVRNDRVV